MESKVVFHSDVALQPLDGGVTRRVLAHLPQQMMVEVSFPEGGKGSLHRHPHVQSTYVLSGEFVFTVEGEDFTVKAGDTLSFAPNAEHGCVCSKAGVLIDVFTPEREDFLSK